MSSMKEIRTLNTIMQLTTESKQQWKGYLVSSNDFVRRGARDLAIVPPDLSI